MVISITWLRVVAAVSLRLKAYSARDDGVHRIKQAEQLKLDDPEKQASLEQINFEQYQADIKYGPLVAEVLLLLAGPAAVVLKALLWAERAQHRDAARGHVDYH
jgi:hypothetical protein